MESIKVNRAFRYAQKGRIEKGSPLVIVLHGYGQLVAYFSKKFEVLENDYLLIFPEGMHRFYLNGTHGRVGASWMTKEWREQDILENNQALETLLDHLKVNFEPTSITVLGFSQGLATAMRWIDFSSHTFDRCISWAGVIPPDLTMTNVWDAIPQKIAVLGTNDRYFDEKSSEEFRIAYTNFGFECITFEGDHDIDQSVLTKLFL